MKPRSRRPQSDHRNKNRRAAFCKNRVPVMASPEQIQKYESILDIAQEKGLTMYQVLEPFSHPDNAECGKLVVLTHLLYRLQVRQCDLDIAVICANDRSEKLLFDSLTDRGLIYQSISTLLPEKDSFGVIVKLRGGCLDDKPIMKTAVDLTIAYDGIFEYSDIFLKQFSYPYAQDKTPMIQLVTMDTGEARSISKLQKYMKYSDEFISLRPNEIELFYTPSRTSWCSLFTDWNEYAADDIMRWLVSTELDYKFKFPPENSSLNEVYEQEAQDRLRYKQDTFKYPRGGNWSNSEAYLRPSLMRILSPKKREVIRNQMKHAVSLEPSRLPRKEEAKLFKQPQLTHTKASDQLERNTINQTSPTALLAIERFKSEFHDKIRSLQQ